MTDISKEAVENLAQECERVFLIGGSDRSHIADTLRAQSARIAELEERQYNLAYAIAGGEDAHGLLDSISTDELCAMIRKERAGRDSWNDATAKIARADALREAINWHMDVANHDAEGMEYSSLVGIPISNWKDLDTSVKTHEWCARELEALINKETP